MSALSLIKEVISREATQRGTTLSINFCAFFALLWLFRLLASFVLVVCRQSLSYSLILFALALNEKTIPHFVAVLHPLLEQQLQLARQAALLDSVQVGRCFACFLLVVIFIATCS